MTGATVYTHRQPDGTTIHIHAGGEITGDAADTLRRELVAVLMRQRPARVVVDLRHVTVLDPAAQGVLDAARDTAEDLGIDLCIHGHTAADSPHHAPDRHDEPSRYRAAG